MRALYLNDILNGGSVRRRMEIVVTGFENKSTFDKGGEIKRAMHGHIVL